MNGIYGALGGTSSFCSNAAIAASVTKDGRALIMLTKTVVETKTVVLLDEMRVCRVEAAPEGARTASLPVIYGDTVR